MSDLISRSALIESFEPAHSRDWYLPWIIYKINEQPTAYDVDAVVEELEQSKKPIIGVKFDSSVPENDRALSRCGFNRGIDKAIEIIRKGVWNEFR